MKITLTGVHPDTHDGQLKNELLQINFPIEVTATKKVYTEEDIDKVHTKWIIYLPNDPDYIHAAWFLTDNEEVNEWITEYWSAVKCSDK